MCRGPAQNLYPLVMNQTHTDRERRAEIERVCGCARVCVCVCVCVFLFLGSSTYTATLVISNSSRSFPLHTDFVTANLHCRFKIQVTPANVETSTNPVPASLECLGCFGRSRVRLQSQLHAALSLAACRDPTAFLA